MFSTRQSMPSPASSSAASRAALTITPVAISVTSFPGRRRWALPSCEAVALIVDDRDLGPHSANVERAMGAGGDLDGLLRLHHVGGHHHPEARQGEHEGQVVDGLG